MAVTREPLCPYCRIPVIEHEDGPTPFLGIRAFLCDAAPIDEAALVAADPLEED